MYTPIDLLTMSHTTGSEHCVVVLVVSGALGVSSASGVSGVVLGGRPRFFGVAGALDVGVASGVSGVVLGGRPRFFGIASAGDFLLTECNML
jgi:hypothetical protein